MSNSEVSTEPVKTRKFALDWTETRKEMVALEQKKDFTDKRLFVPDFDKTGISQTVIRFLPSRDTAVPYVKLFNHSFLNNKMWYIEPCPTTIKAQNKDIKCPVCEYNTENWDSYSEQQQKDRKRKVSYYGNILIVKDPLHPENNGKIFLYRYGKKIHDKLMERSNPPKGSIIESCQIWDWYEGLNFNLIIKKIRVPNEDKAQNNYDSASFVETPTAVGTDDQIEKIINNLYSMKDFYDPKQFKSFDESNERFLKVISGKNTSASTSKIAEAAHTPQETPEVAEDEISDTKSVFSQIADDD